MTSSQDDAWAEQEPLQVKSEEVKLAMATGRGEAGAEARLETREVLWAGRQVQWVRATGDLLVWLEKHTP